MVDRCLNKPRLLEPLARPLVEDRHELGSGAVHLVAQEFGEKVMVTIPLPMVVQRNDKQVRVFQLAQEPPGVLRTRNRLAQGCRQSLQYRALEQKLPLFLRQGRQDLLCQELDDESVTTLERFDKGVHILFAPQREGGEIHRRGHPSVRSNRVWRSPGSMSRPNL